MLGTGESTRGQSATSTHLEPFVVVVGEHQQPGQTGQHQRTFTGWGVRRQECHCRGGGGEPACFVARFDEI